MRGGVCVYGDACVYACPRECVCEVETCTCLFLGACMSITRAIVS